MLTKEEKELVASKFPGHILVAGRHAPAGHTLFDPANGRLIGIPLKNVSKSEVMATYSPSTREWKAGEAGEAVSGAIQVTDLGKSVRLDLKKEPSFWATVPKKLIDKFVADNKDMAKCAPESEEKVEEPKTEEPAEPKAEESKVAADKWARIAQDVADQGAVGKEAAEPESGPRVMEAGGEPKAKEPKTEETLDPPYKRSKTSISPE